MQMSQIPDLTPEELVERWKGKISFNTLRTWRHRGKGPRFKKIGRAVFYPLDEVETYERERKRYRGTAG